MTHYGRRLTRLAPVLFAAAFLAACTSAPAAAVDPAGGVTIDNGTDRAVRIEYEKPDGSTESITDLAAGGHLVIDHLFAGRDGLCRTGRLVARAGDGAELDELYLVCKGQVWAIESS